MIRRLLGILVVFVAVIAFFIVKQKKTNNKDQLVIGLLKTASFPQLDSAQDGFIDEINKDYGDKVRVIKQDAQANLTQAQAIASSFAADNSINAFYAIATPAVQALKATVKDRPIIFSAVTDPVALGLREKNTNITGSSDMADIEKQISIVHQLMPKLSKIAKLYSSGEPN